MLTPGQRENLKKYGFQNTLAAPIVSPKESTKIVVKDQIISLKSADQQQDSQISRNKMNAL